MTQVRTDRSGVDHYYCSKIALELFESSFLGKSPSRSEVQSDSQTEPIVFLKRGSRSAFFLPSVPWKPTDGRDDGEASVQQLRTQGIHVYSPCFVSEQLLTEVERVNAFRSLRQSLYTLSRGVPTPSGARSDDEIDDNGAAHGMRERMHKPLLTIHELEELPSRWVISSISAFAGVTLPVNGDRRVVTGLDVGGKAVRHRADAVPAEDVQWAEGVAPHFEIMAISKLCRGEFWVEVAPVETSSRTELENARRVERVDRDALLLDPPAPLYLDPLLPCDELTTAHASSKCVFLSFFRGAQRITNSKSTADKLAMEKSAEMARIARKWRKELFDRKQEIHNYIQQKTLLVPNDSKISGILSFLDYNGCQRRLTVGMGDQDCMIFCLSAVRSENSELTEETKTIKVEILMREVYKLARLWDRRYKSLSCCPSLSTGSSYPSAEEVVTDCTAIMSGEQHHLFFYHLFVMLLRYQTFFGEKGYNQGPQAAVPPCIMNEIQVQFRTSVEAFASPLNVYAAHTQFCSLFPDVDIPFGGLGSFFDMELISGHYEVNPPFDAEVLRQMQHHILDSIAESDKRGNNATNTPAESEKKQDHSSSLLFVVVLPSHDLDPHERDRGTQGEERMTQGGSRKRPRDLSYNALSTVHRPAGINGSERSVERNLRESDYCLGHIVCHARESAYVDGHQHLLRVPLFRIQTPTRLIVLGNAAARAMYPDTPQRLNKVKEMWRQWTLSTISSPISGGEAN